MATCHVDLIPAGGKNTKKVKGIFHKISEEISVSLAKMCIKDVTAACATDQLFLSKQKTDKRSK